VHQNSFPGLICSGSSIRFPDKSLILLSGVICAPSSSWMPVNSISCTIGISLDLFRIQIPVNMISLLRSMTGPARTRQNLPLGRKLSPILTTSPLAFNSVHSSSCAFKLLQIALL
jgi:hypothetical protein